MSQLTWDDVKQADDEQSIFSSRHFYRAVLKDGRVFSGALDGDLISPEPDSLKDAIVNDMNRQIQEAGS